MEEVIARALALVSSHPESGIAHNLPGRALQKAGRFDADLSELKAATSATPYNFGYLTDLAGAYVARANEKTASGRLAFAKSDLHAAQLIDARARGLSHAFADLSASEAAQHLARGRYTSALTEFSKSAPTGPAIPRSADDSPLFTCEWQAILNPKEPTRLHVARSPRRITWTLRRKRRDGKWPS